MADASLLFDDDCGKCNRWAEFIRKRDPNSRIKLIGQNSTEGIEILKSRPKSMEGLDSVFLISEDGEWFAKSSAIWRICKLLRFPWPIVSAIFFIPSPIRDVAYDIYARMRK